MKMKTETKKQIWNINAKFQHVPTYDGRSAQCQHCCGQLVWAKQEESLAYGDLVSFSDAI